MQKYYIELIRVSPSPSHIPPSPAPAPPLPPPPPLLKPASSSFFGKLEIRTYFDLLLSLMVSAASCALTERGTYIVHMDKSKTRSLETTKKWHEYVMDSVLQLSIQENKEEEAYPPSVLYIYETTMFGFSATLTKSNLKSLTKINSFLYAIPDEMLSLHTTHSPGFLGLNPGRGLWHPKNLASDVIIGVLDTGIWLEHISFAGEGGHRLRHREEEGRRRWSEQGRWSEQVGWR